MITVKSGLSEQSRIALFEQHPDHPGGEIKVTGAGEFEVSPTRLVLAAIGDGRLVEVRPAPVAVEPEDEPEIAPRKRR